MQIIRIANALAVVWRFLALIFGLTSSHTSEKLLLQRCDLLSIENQNSFVELHKRYLQFYYWCLLLSYDLVVKIDTSPLVDISLLKLWMKQTKAAAMSSHVALYNILAVCSKKRNRNQTRWEARILIKCIAEKFVTPNLNSCSQIQIMHPNFRISQLDENDNSAAHCTVDVNKVSGARKYNTYLERVNLVKQTNGNDFAKWSSFRFHKRDSIQSAVPANKCALKIKQLNHD